MAVCPGCEAGVPMNAEKCPSCGAVLQVIAEPNPRSVESLKDDIEDYVRETAPEDSATAEQALETWSSTMSTPPAEIVRSAEEAAPVAVYNAPDETSARLVASLLESGGIDVMVEQHTTPMLDTAQQMLEGFWGQVFVHQKDESGALEILRAYESNEDNLGDESFDATGESLPDSP